jgi:HAD superfamily hydrolase (TIGR01509 family)
MAVKAVVFDLDGTIAKFNLDYKTVRAEVRTLLVRMGVPPSVLSVNESIFEMLRKAEIFMKNNGKPKQETVEIRAKALAIAEKHELEAARTTDIMPGALETLRTLKKMNMKIGLCTVSGEKSTSFMLERFGIADLFDAVTPREKAKNVKPSPEHLEAALKALKVNAGEAMVVGDGVGDMKCAKEMGSVAVGLPTGLSSPKDLIAAGANYFVTAITDVPPLIEYLNKPAPA